MTTQATSSPAPLKHLSFLVLLVAAASSILPLALVALNSVKSHAEITANPLSLPSTVHVENFSGAWAAGNFTTGAINSILLTATAVALAGLVSSMAAFAIARNPKAKIAVVYFLCAGTIPIQLFLFPLYFVFAKAGLLNNVFVTGAVVGATSLPISVALLSTYVSMIPREIDEAARLDGCSQWQTFIYVVLPMIRPGLFVVGIIVGLNAWNEFLITSTFQQGRGSFTMTLGYRSMANQFSFDNGLMIAGALILVAPAIAFFLVVQRQFVTGMTGGAVKG